MQEVTTCCGESFSLRLTVCLLFVSKWFYLKLTSPSVPYLSSYFILFLLLNVYVGRTKTKERSSVMQAFSGTALAKTIPN